MEMQISRRPRRPGLSAALGLAALGALAAGAGQAATLRMEATVMTGLANPRGLTFGPDGALYVAEAGSGGTLGTITAGTGPAGFGLSSGISRYFAGLQTKVAAGLPSLAGADGAEATGVQEVAFDAGGVMHAVIGLGAAPDQRGLLSGIAGAEMLGTLVTFGSGAPVILADLAAHEAANDPDGGVPDSNPYGLAWGPGGFIVTDAGGNTLLQVAPDGAVQTLAVAAPIPNPLPFGPPVMQAVPTGVAIGPDGTPVFGELTGFPFAPGTAEILGLTGGALSTLATGFTNLIDVAFGADGTLYALELDSDSLLGPGTTGSLYSVGSDGVRTLLFGGLDTPTGLAIGADGSFFVAVNGYSNGGGEVIRLSPVPLPGALPALAGGLGLLIGWRRRSRS